MNQRLYPRRGDAVAVEVEGAQTLEIRRGQQLLQRAIVEMTAAKIECLHELEERTGGQMRNILGTNQQMDRSQRSKSEQAFGMRQKVRALDGDGLDEAARELPIFGETVKRLRPCAFVFGQQIGGLAFESAAPRIIGRQHGETALRTNKVGARRAMRTALFLQPIGVNQPMRVVVRFLADRL